MNGNQEGAKNYESMTDGAELEEEAGRIRKGRQRENLPPHWN